MQPRWLAQTPLPGMKYAATDNGWMIGATFFMWMRDMFVPHVNEKRVNNGLGTKPAVLLFDGHSSLISMKIIDLANNENIRLVKFPSHLTDKMQPLDVSVFGPIKKTWNETLVEHGRTMMGNREARLQKYQFVDLHKIKPSNTTSGFRATGIFPINKGMVKDTWFTPAALMRYQAAQMVQRLPSVNRTEVTDPQAQRYGWFSGPFNAALPQRTWQYCTEKI